MDKRDIERFWAKVDKTGDCWAWQGRPNDAGYGRFSIGPRGDNVVMRAHRIAYELEVGPIPPGTEIDHLCRNRICVRPAHLEAVPHQVNQQRSPIIGRWDRGPTCKRGHEFTEENTAIVTRPTGATYRRCRRCQREQKRERRRRARGG